MTDISRTPVFDANGWCHDMSKAPRDIITLLDLWHVADFRICDAYYCYVYQKWENASFSYADDKFKAWRYPPAPPVGANHE